MYELSLFHMCLCVQSVTVSVMLERKGSVSVSYDTYPHWYFSGRSCCWASPAWCHSEWVSSSSSQLLNCAPPALGVCRAQPASAAPAITAQKDFLSTYYLIINNWFKNECRVKVHSNAECNCISLVYLHAICSVSLYKIIFHSITKK